MLEASTPDDPVAQKHLQCVVSLLRVELQNNCFIFNGHYYEQLQGIPMGRAWAPAVASIFMNKWDLELLKRCNHKPLAFWRFIDDILLVFETRDHAEQALATMQSIHEKIRVSDIQISKSVHFLDLSLSIVSNSKRESVWHRMKVVQERGWNANQCHVETSLFRKAQDTIALLCFTSAHPFSVKTAVVYSQCLRAVRISNNFVQAGIDVGILLRVMQNTRHMPTRTRWRIIRKLIVWTVTHFLCVVE
jgi:hypothetical protein